MITNLSHGMHGFVLLDGALLTEVISRVKELHKNFVSLYKGLIEDELDVLGPHLILPENSVERVDTMYMEYRGKQCCIVLFSKASFMEVKDHFTKLIMVKTDLGEDLYFRFYDPRVLKIFLPTCDKQQILEFFGPVESFIVEGDSKEEVIRFWQQNGELQTEVLSAEKVFGQMITTEQL